MEWLLSATPTRLAAHVFIALFVALGVVVLYQAMQAGLTERGLLSASGNGPAEPERVAMVVATFAAVAAYCHQCLGTRPWPTDVLPEPHDWIVWIVAGGQGSYLIGKMLRLS